MLAIYKDASKGHLDSDSVSVNQDGQCHGQHLASILYLWTSTIPLSCFYHASTMLPQASIFWATSGVHPGPWSVT